MFGALLLEASCGADWGIQQAWYIMQQTEQSMPGLITDKICNMQRAENIKIGDWSMKDNIKKWLDENEEFKAKLQVKKVGNKCTGNAQSTSENEGASTALSAGHGNKIKQKKSAAEILWGKVKNVVREARKEVRHKIKDLNNNIPSQPYANVTPRKDYTDISDSEEENEEDEDGDDDDAGEEDANGPKLEDTGGARSLPPSQPGAQPQAPASPVLPARPPPPEPARSAAGQGESSKESKETGKCSKGTETYTVKNAGAGVHGSTSNTYVSFGTTSDIDGTCGKKPEDSGPAVGSEKPGASAGPSPPAPEPVNEEVQATSPGTGHDTSAPGSSVNSSTDDPPPLNPPKPKPPPTPDQSGSSGDDTTTAGGVSGGEGKGGGGGGQKDGGGPGSGSAAGGGSSGGGAGGRTEQAGTLTPATPSVPPGLTWEDIKPYTPAIIPAVVGIGVIAFFLWKYFAYLGQKRRRTYRTVRDVPSPPLDEEILDHLQRGELPPPDYGYTMIRDTQPPSTSGRGRPPRVHKRTIMELHLEVLNECEATEWENVKDDFYGIILEEFAHDLEPDANGHSSFPDAPTTNQGLSGNHVSCTLDPPTDIERTDACLPNEEDPEPWKCMETTELETNACPPNDPDPWSCMENIPLAHDATLPAAPSFSDPEHATSDCTQWINWIDRNKYFLRECTTQPWFLQLKAEWKQYLREHMVANEDNAVYGHIDNGEAATLQMNKLRLWKQWVAQQHAQVLMYCEEAWFKHLLDNIAEDIVSPTGEVPVVEKDLKMEIVTAAEDILRVRDLPRSQLHRQPHMKKRLTAQTWILILALVMEQCEVESRLQEKELYVDELLQQL
ncbi:hypothetical protein AK88_04619 [Plasmodium fragile]|uniref:Schizont-infected cell agglutination C-terminal domain-containing protein n=1 Tax=Plasmodium fragile TaxID=5857 RepID=A0A0D9QFH5_PLAFR|nr:uncharacterized protein AK88_04619 [Plasmodium fragile]KJP85749.1 hypothetical protein AK88_04619 [Plasmodium fragile]